MYISLQAINYTLRIRFRPIKKASGGIYVNFDNSNKNKALGRVHVHLKNEYAVVKSASLECILIVKKAKNWNLCRKHSL